MARASSASGLAVEVEPREAVRIVGEKDSACYMSMFEAVPSTVVRARTDPESFHCTGWR